MKTAPLKCFSRLSKPLGVFSEVDRCIIFIFSVTSHSGLRPADLAARCGYVDCALYLQRAAEQQALKQSGIIDDVVLPVVQSHAVLPGQKPDKCVITQVR